MEEGSDLGETSLVILGGPWLLCHGGEEGAASYLCR